MFALRFANDNLCGNHILSLPKPRTTTYGLHSFISLLAKLWNFSVRQFANISPVT